MILERALQAALTMAALGLFWRGVAALRGRRLPRGHRVFLLASVLGGVMGLQTGYRLLTAGLAAPEGGWAWAGQALAGLCTAPLSWWWGSQLWLTAPLLVLLLAIHDTERRGEGAAAAGLGMVVSWASALGLSLARGRLDEAASEAPATSVGAAILAVVAVSTLPLLPEGGRLPVLMAAALLMLLPLTPLRTGPRIAPRQALLALGSTLAVVRVVQSTALLGSLSETGLTAAIAAHSQALQTAALLGRLHWDYLALCAVVGAFLLLRAGRRGIPWLAAALLLSPPVVLAFFLGTTSVAASPSRQLTGAEA